jgi:hypothetical protein
VNIYSPKPFSSEKTQKKRELALPFLTSAFIHGGIILLIGGAVLVPGIIPKAPFVGEMVTPSALTDDNLDPIDDFLNEDPVTDLPAQDMPDVAMPPAGAMEQTYDIIATTSTTPSFSLPVGSGVLSNVNASAFGTGRGGSTGTNVSPNARATSHSFFGRKDVKNGLVGQLFDLKQTADGKPTPMALAADEKTGAGVSNSPEARAANQAFRGELSTLIDRKFNESVLRRYFKAPVELSIVQFFVPTISAGEAPKAFEVADQVQPRRWAVIYTGSIRPPATGRFRFVGRGDDVLVVRVGNQVVLDGSLSPFERDANSESGVRTPDGTSDNVAGKWISLNANQTYPITVLVAETPGGVFYMRLFVQQEGREFPGGAALFQASAADLPKQLEGKAEALVFDATVQ